MTPCLPETSHSTTALGRLSLVTLLLALSWGAQTVQAVNSQETFMPGVKSLSSLTVPGDWSTHQPRASPLFERESLLDYFQRCSKSYIAKTDPRRFLRQRELFEQVTGTEGTAIVVEDPSGDDADDTYWVNMAIANTLPQQALGT